MSPGGKLLADHAWRRFPGNEGPRATGRFWCLLLLGACASWSDRPPTTHDRPLCAQPFDGETCLEGTWAATWRDGRWDCKIIQDQLELDGIPADRCTGFVGLDEVAERLRMDTGRRSRTHPR